LHAKTRRIILFSTVRIIVGLRAELWETSDKSDSYFTLEKKACNVCRGSIFVEMLTSSSEVTYQNFSQRDPRKMGVKAAELWF